MVPHAFEAKIERLGIGRTRVLVYKVLFLPRVVEAELPFDAFPRLRVEGEIADVPVRGAWLPVGDGRRYFIVPPDVKRLTGFDVGSEVEFRFRVDDQDRVDTPPGLLRALAADADARSSWEGLTPGKRRGLAFHVAAAKSRATIDRRVAEVLEALARGCTIRDLKNAAKGP